MMKFGQNMKQGKNMKDPSSMATAHMVRSVFADKKNESSVLESSLSGFTNDEEQVQALTEMIETRLKEQKNQLERFHKSEIKNI